MMQLAPARRLDVLSVAFPFAPVGPDAAGGAEQVLSIIDRGLVARGHGSSVIAQAGSVTAGRLMATPVPAAPFDETTRLTAWDAQRRAIADALHQVPVDVVHVHGLDFTRYLPDVPVPLVATLHLPTAWYEPPSLDPSLDVARVFVSEAQRRALARGSSLGPVIENGIEVDRFDWQSRRQPFVAAIGRICVYVALFTRIAAGSRAAGATAAPGHEEDAVEMRHVERDAASCAS